MIVKSPLICIFVLPQIIHIFDLRNHTTLPSRVQSSKLDIEEAKIMAKWRPKFYLAGVHKITFQMEKWNIFQLNMLNASKI